LCLTDDRKQSLDEFHELADTFAGPKAHLPSSYWLLKVALMRGNGSDGATAEPAQFLTVIVPVARGRVVIHCERI
jgi:hypothetical protein